ncbi:MAG: rhodanese-like domain-containing protein [Leptolyngbya sp. SIO1D8]|nr:rhodanese-like domain-containing protein [Leptolyngbya sp. SIO1D8]
MNRFLGLFSNAPAIRAVSRVYDLKARLDWGEPALTILDVRNLTLFNEGHVTGAIFMPVDELLNRAKASLEFARDLYVYAETDEEAGIAAEQLRMAGYESVSVLRGGVAAWKAAGFPVEVSGAIAA